MARLPSSQTSCEMDLKKSSTLGKVSAQVPSTSSQRQGSVSTPNPQDYTSYKVRVPRNLVKKYNVMGFNSASKVDLSSVTKAQMNRVLSDAAAETDTGALPNRGEGSEYGWAKREEARKRRFGFTPKPKNPESAPWSLRLGGKAGKRFTGRKESGFNTNSAYYVLTQCPDGAFEAVPITSWYNFTPDINYKTLTMDEAEEEFNQRHKTINYFAMMVKKRLENKDREQIETSDMTTSKAASKTSALRIHDDEEELSSSEDDEVDEDDKQDNKSKMKTVSKKKKTAKDAVEDSDVSSEEDGYLDSKEVDYMSDSSSEEEKETEQIKPNAKDDLNAKEGSSSSEDDEELTNEGKKLKEMLNRDAETRDSDDEDDDDEEEDPDANPNIGGPSALFLQGQKGKKTKSGSRSSSSSNSRSSTPTTAIDGGTASTIAAAAKKLNEDKPGTPSKGKKRPKGGTDSEDGSPASKRARGSLKRLAEDDSPASKKARTSPAPSAQGNSGTSTPTPSVGGEDSSAGITDEAVRRYLTRKPMTTKDLLQKFKTKRTGLTNKQTVELIAGIVKKLQPEQKTIKGKMYLSLKPS